jgi:DNA polymerase-3 subunit alpha
MNNFNINNIPLDDRKTWDNICKANVCGYFQADSSIGEKVLKMVQPRNIKELSDCVALQRPPTLLKNKETGLSVLDKYCKIKFGFEQPHYIHESLKPILSNTYSLIIFQEQILEIAHKIAGYSLWEADTLRAAIGKKDVEKLEGEEEKFIKGAIKNGYGKDVAEVLWKQIENSSAYLFNLSHAVVYGFLTYQTAYLKAHYPTEFMTSLLIFSKRDPDKEEIIEDLYNECKRLGIKLLPPSINRLNEDFQMINKIEIAFGLSHIKGIGVASIKKLNNVYKDKKIDCFDEFIKIALINKINKKTIEGLILSGALDICNESRKSMYIKYQILQLLTPRELTFFWNLYKDNMLSTMELLLNDVKINKKRLKSLTTQYKETAQGISKEYSLTKLLLDEKFYLNATLSGSLVDCLDIVKNKVTCRLIDLSMCYKKEKINVGGVVESIREVLTKKDDKMAFISISDASYKTDVVVFPDIWLQVKKKIEIGTILFVIGTADNGKIIAGKIETYEIEKPGGTK